MREENQIVEGLRTNTMQPMSTPQNNVFTVFQHLLCFMFFINFVETLTGLNASLSDAMMVHLFVKDMDDFAKVNSIYKTFVKVNPPAR